MKSISLSIFIASIGISLLPNLTFAQQDLQNLTPQQRQALRSAILRYENGNATTITSYEDNINALQFPSSENISATTVRNVTENHTIALPQPPETTVFDTLNINNGKTLTLLVTDGATVQFNNLNFSSGAKLIIQKTPESKIDKPNVTLIIKNSQGDGKVINKKTKLLVISPEKKLSIHNE